MGALGYYPWEAVRIIKTLFRDQDRCSFCLLLNLSKYVSVISAVRLFSTLELKGGLPEKNSDSSVSQLSALATLRPIWGRVGQGAFELSLPQIRSFFFLETLACLDISTKKICL